MQETASKINPIGLYKDEKSGQYLGAVEEVQADAYIRVGFTLVKEGMEAAKMTQIDIEKLDKRKEV